VGDLSKVVSPPYDIISPEDRIHYHKRHPQNFVRLILGEESATDTDSNNRFTRAKKYLHTWLSRGILKQDYARAIYVYQQRYEREGRACAIRGLVCAVRVHDYSDGVILPHENTLAKPKSQLIQLMRETRANLDSIYALYADEAGVLDAVMDRAMAGRHACEARDKDGVLHLLWVLLDPNEIAKIVDHIKPQPIAIADGHHRYETALAYRDEMRAQHGGAAELPSDYTLMTIANVYQKDMTIFPTHRVVAGLAGDVISRLDRGLGELFEVGASSGRTLLSDMAELGAIGMYRAGSAVTLKPKPESRALLQGSEASRDLELNVLHKLILERVLAIGEEDLRNQTHIVYTRDPAEAMRLVDSGERQVAFLLNHIDVKSVLDIATAGERMPQKATYFYPKLLSGLVLRKFDS
jgi:uncharacterized protein (DUF1015 family)